MRKLDFNEQVSIERIVKVKHRPTPSLSHEEPQLHPAVKFLDESSQGKKKPSMFQNFNDAKEKLHGRPRETKINV